MSQRTALILIDVYNDFLHPEGKATGALAESLEKSKTIHHLKLALDTAHNAQIPVYYSLHQQYHDGKYAGFRHWNEMLRSVESTRAFEEGSFGAQIYEGLAPTAKLGDTVISKHWNQSSFQNTDLDWLLRQKDITHVVLAGLVANTCLETTARVANELYVPHPIQQEFYPQTVLNVLENPTDARSRSDATAGWTTASMDAAVQHSWPSFAHEVLATTQWSEKLVRNVVTGGGV